MRYDYLVYLVVFVFRGISESNCLKRDIKKSHNDTACLFLRVVFVLRVTIKFGFLLAVLNHWPYLPMLA